ncbi:hypothetical protein FAI41_05315 [Acetobacteraceae bacterium]|nr:hypothetical protein FAI41_05315 [Acetobacteraceae bacterium]
MIICSCNLISDKDVFAAISAGACRPSQIYAHKKCKADCGGCTKQICRLLKEKRNTASSDNSCPRQNLCAKRHQPKQYVKSIENLPLMHEAPHVLSA